MEENYNQYSTIPVESTKKPFYERREFWGSAFFLLIVIMHILNSRFINIESQRVGIIVTQLLIVVPAFIYMGCYKQNPFKFMRFRKFHLGSAFLIPLFMFSLLPVMGLINSISMLFATEAISGTVNDITGGNLFAGVLLVAALPAFVEECTFRGAIYHSMRGARPVRAIILSGLMFGAMHMNFNQFCYAAVLGIVMGFLLEATGSIVSTMILHFCFNANSVILMYALPKLYDILGKLSNQPSGGLDFDSALNQAQNASPAQMLSTVLIMIPIAAGGGALAFLFYYLIAKLNKRWYYIRFLFSKKTKDQRDSFEKPRLLYVVTFIGFAICLAMCILTELVLRDIISIG